MLVPLTEINNCYILQKPIGQDSCTEHWLASAIYSPHTFLIRFVKEELSSPASLEQFRLESMRYYSFEGSAFSDFIEIEYFDKRLFISSEYHGEGTLTEKSQGDGTRDPELSCSAILNLASGIDRIHERQMIFGSLTPENIEIVSAGKSDHDFRLRTPGYFLLYQALRKLRTDDVAYKTFLSPELRSGAKPGRTADVYSLGVTLAWLLTGPRPVLDSSFPANLADEFRKRMIPDELSRIIHKSIQQEPSNRYQNCTNFMDEIQAYLKASRKAEEEAKKGLSSSQAKADIPIPAAPSHVILPEAAPRHEVLTYFQELSADYFSAPGKYPASKEQKTTPVLKPVPRYTAPVVSAVSNPSADYFNGSSAVDETSAMLAKPIQAAPTKEDPGIQEVAPEPSGNVPVTIPPTIPAPVRQSLSEHPAPKTKPVRIDRSVPGDRKNKALSPQKDTTTVPTWKYRRVALDDIPSRLLGSVRRARGSRGAVHYLGESDFKETNKLVEKLFADLHTESEYLDLGSFLRFGDAGVQDFLNALRVALSVSVSSEKPYSLSRFARMVELHGAKAFFGSEPLGRILYGKDEAEEIVAVSDWDNIIRALTVFGRKKKPLVLVIRGGESFKPELTAFFNSAVPILKDKPVCLFLFRKDFPAILRILGVMDPHP